MNNSMTLRSLIIVVALVTLAASCFGQTLPSSLVGTGASWLRGATYPFNNETSFDKLLGSSWYVDADVVTPVVKQAAGSAPTPSTIQAGADWVAACSPSKSVCFMLSALGGASAATGGAGVAPAFTGAMKIWFRIGQHIYIEPSAKVSNAAYSPTSGALATAVFSPSLQVLYGFASTPAPVVPLAAPANGATAKAMRRVFARLHLPGPNN